MDHKTRTLFDVVGDGDDVALQRLLLEGKEERNIATLAHGNTVLHESAWKGYSRCAKILCNVYPKEDDQQQKEKLEWKKNHFINRVNFCGFTALHLAAQNGHNQTLRELLYAGCSTSIHNDYGDTALHTACRYGHAGVVRIIISAKCDVDAFNLNHDTPLHITCAMGRRKLTKLLLDAGAMQFQNLQHETPRDIAQRKNLTEILSILEGHADRTNKKLLREDATRKSQSKSPASGGLHLLPHNSKLKYNDHPNPKHWSPYGCHYYPDTRNFPSPKLESLPQEPLKKGEQYYLDLAGKIHKGPVGKGNTCYCAPFMKESHLQHVERANEKLDKRISAMATKAEKTDKKQRHSRERSKEHVLDPLYTLVKIVGDKNKQLHMEKWLQRVHPEAGSQSDPLQSPRSSEKVVQEVPVTVHRENHRTKVTRSNSKMPEYDENRKHLSQHDEDDEDDDDDDDENDDSYTDISEDGDDHSSVSDHKNPLYDEGFLRNFQHHQQFYQNTQHNDSLTSPSISSNQNIEMEMERITKSLLLDSTIAPPPAVAPAADDIGVMVSSRNPDVIRDHIHHSAKRSRKSKLEIKSAITKPTSVLASGELYVNSFFANAASAAASSGVNGKYKPNGNKNDDEDEVDAAEMDQLVAQVQETILNSSNVSSISSTQNHIQQKQHESTYEMVQQRPESWNRVGRSRNPLPMNIDEIEKYADSIFKHTTADHHHHHEVEQSEETTLNGNNFILLDKLLKARKQFNQTYQQQLEMMNQPSEPRQRRDNGDDETNEFTIPSASTLV